MPEAHDILIATAFGLESVVQRELADLGYEAKGLSTGRVLLRGDDAAIARCNLRLRTADRVMVRVAAFPSPDFDALFEGVKALPWEDWIPAGFAFPVSGRSVRSRLSSVPACQRTVKKAIVERLMRAQRVTTLPEDGPTVAVEIALLNDTATLTIDTSGAGLHKRGYRPHVGEAALKETLAAGLVLLSVWKPDRPLIDPFCGTGTIAIEAAMIGRNIAPGLQRAFDAERWPRLAAAFTAAREEAASLPRQSLAHAIHASDIDEQALGIARRAATAAGVERDVHFRVQPFESLSSKREYGCIITNPPYGVRLGQEEDVERLYRSMPLVLRRLPTWSFHIFTARLDLEALFGQPAARRRKLFNSTIECTYFTFLGPRPPRAGDEPAGDASASDSHDSETHEELSADEPAEHPADNTPQSGAGPAPHRESRAAPGPAFGGLRDRDERELAEFRARLTKNVQHLRRYPSRGVTCYRVYERDCPDVPLIIDLYEGRAHAAEYERLHSRNAAQQADWWDKVRAIIAEACGIDRARVYTKEKHRQRGLTQHEKVDESGESFVVQEGGLKFEVNLRDYTDTGLFLDHRLTRQMVRERAAGKRVLNLFCYTGSFTVYAAAGAPRKRQAWTFRTPISRGPGATWSSTACGARTTRWCGRTCRSSCGHSPPGTASTSRSSTRRPSATAR